jgi:hypothetical protein
LYPIVSPLAFADSGTWSLDATTSSARLFQVSTTNPDSVNTGVSRVTGKVMLDMKALDNSVLDLRIYPADENWGHARTTLLQSIRTKVFLDSRLLLRSLLNLWLLRRRIQSPEGRTWFQQFRVNLDLRRQHAMNWTFAGYVEQPAPLVLG